MLKVLMLRRRIDLKKKELAALREKLDGCKTREDELAQAIEEVETDEQRTAVEEEITAFEQERDTAQESADQLEQEISDLESELQQGEEAQDTTPPAEGGEGGEAARSTGSERTERGGEISMNRRTYFELNTQERRDMVGRQDVGAFLTEVRSAISEQRAISGAGLTIPDVFLPLLREQVARSSKLLPFVALQRVGGKARQNILGAIPEAVWTEMCASINELTLAFNQIEVDGYKVAGYVAVCNAAIEDSDEDLAGIVLDAIAKAIAKALDKAIIFGKGTKMPLGIATRLAQTSEPANWDANGPAWTDLHTSNVQTINVNAQSGAAFFIALVAKLAIAKPKYSSEGLFWVMNRKTHLDIMAKALGFNAQGALVSGTQLMPVVGGTVVELEDDEMADYEIIGGFGGNYVMAERAGVQFASSDIPLFLQDQTVFKGTARYDGKPAAGEAFVIVNYNNTSPTTSKDFAPDWANTELNVLGLVAAAGTASGDTVITVADYLSTSTPTLKYKVGKVAVEVGDSLPSGFEDLTSGTTQVTAAKGKIVTVVELDANSKIVSAGYVASVPHA